MQITVFNVFWSMKNDLTINLWIIKKYMYCLLYYVYKKITILFKYYTKLILKN